MNQERWQETSLRSMPSTESDRYERDLRDANILRAGMRKSGSKRAEVGVLEDIELGLRGLDQAERHKSEGNLPIAKELYEKSLELLIRHLKGNEGGFDKETLQARVEIAFQDAELIKGRLATSSPQSPPDLTSKPSFRNLTSALSSALTKPSPAKATSPQSQTCTPSNRRRVSQHNNQGTTRQVASKSRTSRPQTRPVPKANDETRRVILTDFLVDRSQIDATSWDDIAGLVEAKQSLQETAILPLIRPDLFTGLRKPQNVLLWGPPGTGKTLMVRAVARESGSNLFSVSASVLTSKWMGDSEKLVRTLFQVAREASPSIIFIDEMDSLLSSRKSDGEHEASRRLKTEFMVQTDGMTKEGNGVLVLACTNCPWDVDSAVMRRFPRRIYVPLPDPEARAALIKNLLKKAKKHSLTSRDVSNLVKRTKGFSGSDIAAIASEAAFGPLRSLGGMDAIRNARANDVRPLSYSDFDNVIKNTTRSVTNSQLKKYVEWQSQQA